MINVEELKKAGNDAFAACNYTAAVDFFSQAIALDSSNHVLYSNRSAAYASLKNWTAALTDAEKTVTLKPDWPKGYSRKGAALFGMQKTQDALAAYEAGLALEPSNAQLKKGAADCHAALEQSAFNPFAAPDVLAKIATNPKVSSYLAQPDFVEKLKDLQKDPSKIGAYMQDKRIMEAFAAILGVDIEMPPKEKEKAEETKQEIPAASASSHAKQPEQPQYPKEPTPRSESDRLKEAGNVAYKSKNFADALANYNQALSIDPSNVAVMNNIAAVYFEQERWDDCIAQCLDAVQAGREHRADFKITAKALGRVGSVYLKEKEYEKAIDYFKKSLADHRAPDILAKLKEAEKYLEQAEKARLHNPALAEEHRSTGNDLFKTGNFADAVKEYSTAITHDENDPRAYSNRAACYIKLGAVQEALKDCEKAISLDPSFIKAYIRKAQCLFLKRDYLSSVDVCRAALDLDKEGRHASEIQSQMSAAYAQISAAQSSEDAAKNALNDPEVQSILADPVMQSILQQMQSDPKALQDHMKNPVVAGKIRKLMASGILRMGRE